MPKKKTNVIVINGYDCKLLKDNPASLYRNLISPMRLVFTAICQVKSEGIICLRLKKLFKKLTELNRDIYRELLLEERDICCDVDEISTILRMNKVPWDTNSPNYLAMFKKLESAFRGRREKAIEALELIKSNYQNNSDTGTKYEGPVEWAKLIVGKQIGYRFATRSPMDGISPEAITKMKRKLKQRNYFYTDDNSYMIKELIQDYLEYGFISRSDLKDILSKP